MDLPIKIEGIVYSKTGSDYQFLIIKRVPEDGGFWQPLTETMEEGETIEECLRRGFREELSLDKITKITDRVWSFTWENKKGEPNIDLVYGVEIPGNSKIKLEPSEHSEYKWCNFDTVMKLLGKDNNKHAFEHFKEKMML